MTEKPGATKETVLTWQVEARIKILGGTQNLPEATDELLEELEEALHDAVVEIMDRETEAKGLDGLDGDIDVEIPSCQMVRIPC